MAIDSIQIIRKDDRVWRLKDNTLAEGAEGYGRQPGWSMAINGDYVTINTKNGSNVYLNQPYTIFSYIDETDPDNNVNTFASSVALETYLVQQGFFGSGSSDEPGSVPAIQDLSNSLIANLAGRGGQFFRVKPDESGFDTAAIGNPSMKDLQEWDGGNLILPNKFFATTSATDTDGNAYIIQVDLSTAVNTPIENGESRILFKGDGNTEPFLREIGDYCGYISPTLNRYVEGYWLGGTDVLDDDNYDIRRIK